MKFKDTKIGTIPSHWEVQPIKEITELVTDYVANGSFASLAENVTYKDEEDVAVLIRLVDYNNDFQGKFVFIDEHAYQFLGKSKLFGGEIIISNVGANVGTVFRCPQLAYKMSLAPNSIMVKFKGNDDFYFHWLRGFNGQQMLKSIVTGSAQPKFNKTNFKEMLAPVPPIGEQNKIASILNTIDEKIEINKKINENLAVLLQTVYQERFGDVDKASKQGVLSDICSYSKDRVAVSDLDVSTYFSTENMLPRKAGSTETTSLPTMPQTTACHKGDTLISNIRPYFKKIVYCEDECGCSTDVLCFMPNQPQYSAYLFSTLYADKFFAFMVAGAKGTKMPRGDKQQIMTYPIVMPSEVALAEFNTIALPLIKQIYSNRAENKRLSLLRDTLLPKLMSGELDVSDIDL